MFHQEQCDDRPALWFEKRNRTVPCTAHCDCFLDRIQYFSHGRWLFPAPALLSMMNTPESMMADSVTYLRIFLPRNFVYIHLQYRLQYPPLCRRFQRPLYYLIVCCFLNIGLDLLFVLVFHMGIAGAAIATVLSLRQSVPSLYCSP